MTTVTASNFPLSYSGASALTSTTLTNNYNAHAMPGAWIYSSNGSYPIYYSIADFGTNQYGFTSTTYYQIMPGYKIIYYTSSYFSGTSATIDNSNNSYLLSQSITATIYSIKLYYQGVEITNIKQSQQTSLKLPYSIKSQYPNTIDPTGLLYYYKFDTDTLDYSSGYGVLNGTNTGSIVTTATKLYSGSLYLNNGNYFQVPTHTIDQTKGYSVALWYRLNSTPTGTYPRILDIAKGINQSNGMALYYSSSNNLSFSSNTGGTGDTGLNYAMDNNWHHVCMTCSINGYWTVYIDGCEMRATIIQTLPFVTTNSAGAWFLNKSNNTTEGTANANFNQLLIFARELKPYEVYYLYNSPTTLNLSYLPLQISNQNLKYYYPFTNNLNNYSYTTGIDDSSHTGTTIDTTNTIMNYGSLNINSANGFFQVPSHYIKNKYSISFWYKLNSYSSGTYSKIIILANSLSGGSSGGPSLSYANANSGSIYFTPIDGQTPNISIGYTMDFNWHHICLIYNGSWTIYIDGINIYSITSTIVSSLINYYYIGKSTYSAHGNTNANFNQFTIFNKELSITEINTLYKNPTNYINISNILYYYPFNTNFNNISTSGKVTPPYNGLDDSNHGALTIDNTKTIMSTGSLKVDSSTGVFQVPPHYITNGYTVAFWYKLSAYSTGTYSKIIHFGTALSGGSPGGPSLSFANASSGALYFSAIDGQTSNISTGYTMDLNWHHICLVYNGSWTIYIDGINIYSISSTIVSSLINYYYIGKSTYTTDGNTIANFNQLIIMKRAISLTELFTLYQYPLNTITLPCSYYYPFQSNFNNCYDLLNPIDDSIHTGLIIDSTIRIASSGSLKVDSSVTAFQVPSHYITNGYTVAFWYKLSAYSTGTYSKIIHFGTALSGGSPGGPSLSFANASSGALYFATIDGQTSNISTGYTMDLNWHHICLVYNGLWSIYIDSNKIYSVSSTIVSSLINYYYIGKSTYTNDGNTVANFNQLVIFNRELSQSEISLLYNNPSNQITLSGMKYYYPFQSNFNNYLVPIVKGIDDSSRASGGGAYIDQTTTKMSIGSLYLDSSKGVGVFALPKHYITPNYSIAMWYKLKSYPTGSWSRIFDLAPVYGQGNTVTLTFSNTTGTLYFTSKSLSSQDNPIGYVVSDFNWHHICCTYASPIWKVYIDGTLYYTQSSTITTPSPTTLLNSPLIGQSVFSNDANGIANFNQLAVFNITLSQSQITTLASSTNSSSMIDLPNMMFYYPFNTNFNNYVNIFYSGINDASYSSFLDTVTTKMDTGAGSLKVTSASNSFMVPAHNITSGYTIAFWYKLSAYPTAAYARIFDFSTQTTIGSAGGPVLFYNGTTGAIAFSPSVSGYANNVTTIYTIDLNWHHICITYINSSWNIYIDGALIKNMSYTASTSLLNYCSIGKSNYSGDGNAIANFNQLAIFERVLSDSEIMYLYSYPTYNINSTLNYVSGKVETSKTSLSKVTNYAYPGYGTGLNTNKIVKDNLGNIYLNLTSRSVSIYRKSTGLWTTIDTDPNQYSNIGAYNNILYYSKLIIPTAADTYYQLYRYDITTNSNIFMRNFNYRVNAYIIDITNNYLVVGGFFGGGILWFNLTTYAYVGNTTGLSTSCMAVDSYNNLWCGYIRDSTRAEANRNIFIYNISTGYFNRDVFTSIYGGIYHITIDKLNNVYAAGGINDQGTNLNQITKYTYSTGIWSTLTGMTGTITALSIDSLNNLYVSGNLTIGSTTVNLAYYNGTWNTVSYVYGTLDTLYIDTSDNFYFGGSSLSSDILSNTMFIQYNSTPITTITTTPISTISYPATSTNSYPTFPGCYYLSKQNTVYPIYTSTNTIAAKDDVWWVLPGYKIIVYIGTNYTSSNFIVDNTYGFNNMSKMSDYPNQVQSVKMFYNGQQLIDGAPQLSNSVNMFTNTIPISVPYTYSVSTNESVINSSFPSYPGAWMIGTNSTMPIYISIQDLTLMSYGSKDLKYMILPGFKIILYSGTNYTGTTQTYDNSGYNMYYPQLTTQSTTKSIELYYNGMKIFSYKNYYANKDNIDFAVSVRLVIPSYSGPVVNVRNSSTNVTQDFYADKFQTYLTTGPNNTGTTYASWISTNTGYITKLYDQSNKGNHAINAANNTTQPNLALINNKYVIQFQSGNSTVLNLTRSTRPNTIFCHFYNTNLEFGTIISTNSDYGMRFGAYQAELSGRNINGNTTQGDWYFSSIGTKLAYANNVNITSTNTLSATSVWQVFSVSVQTSIWWSGTITNEYFTKIGKDGYSNNRSINGYMTEMICHNKQMFESDMINYYNDSLFTNQLTIPKIYTTPTTYDLPITYDYTKSSNITFAISMRLIISTYTGPIVNVRNSSTSVTQDFYTDKYQTYLTTGPNNTGTTYAAWISTYTGYITKMYDQSGQGNHAINSTNATQPNLALVNSKYVIQFNYNNSTTLSLTTQVRPNTIFSHFYDNTISTENIYTLITSSGDFSMRIIIPAGTTVSNSVNTGDGGDWYYQASGTKLSYINGSSGLTINTTLWTVLSLSVQTPVWTSRVANAYFTAIGSSGYSAPRGMNGYMTEMICHNTQMVAADMVNYYNDRLF
uniref:LamG-like jellyroll fold domain-containing protein n=1 Tax=viral metagenome TaxID=1070528 RepID=A0A6C0D2L0_9ZZZZ